MIRVLLIDDDEDVRSALRVILERHEGLLVAGAAGDGRAGLAAVAHFAPDVVLLDLHMPVMSGVQVLQELQRQRPPFKVLVLTSFDDPEHIVAALRAGADGYLLKSSSGSQIVRAIGAVVNDEFPLTPSVVRQLVSEARAGPVSSVNLTPREADVLAGLARGLTNQALAEELFIEVCTVKQYVGTLSQKLGAANRTQIVVAATSMGLVSLKSSPW